MANTPGDYQNISALDREFLNQCIELAEQALHAGDEPFGSVLVSEEGSILFEDRNRVKDGDHTQHPEFAIARWSAQNLSRHERQATTVYTSGEHCPMCSAAHAWVGLGRIIYASSSEQLTTWRKQWGLSGGPVNPLPINEVAPHVPVAGPVSDLADRIKVLQALSLGVNVE